MFDKEKMMKKLGNLSQKYGPQAQELLGQAQEMLGGAKPGASQGQSSYSGSNSQGQSGYPGANTPGKSGYPGANAYSQPSNPSSTSTGTSSYNPAPGNPYANIAQSTTGGGPQTQAYSGYSSYPGAAAPSSASPPLSNMNAWFDYHDRDRSGQLEKEEVVKALIDTFTSAGHTVNHQSIRENVYSVWPAFDKNGNGSIDRTEFMAPGGLGESLQAMMKFISPGSAASPPSASAPPPYNPYTSSPAPSQPYNPHAASATPSQPYNPHAASAMPSQTYNPHASQPYNPYATSTAPPPQQPGSNTFKVPIPQGMNPGQTVRVSTPNGVIPVTIPPRHQWNMQPDGTTNFLFNPPSSNVVVQGTVLPSSPPQASAPTTSSYR